jgi:plastocyanin
VGIDMTAITQKEKPTLQTGGPQLGRTFAMTLVSGGCVAMVAGLVLFLVALALPIAGEPGFTAIMIPIFVAFIAIFIGIGILSVVWTGSTRRAWFWLAATVPALLIVLLNARHIPYDFSHPADAIPFLVTIGAIPGAFAIMVGGVAAFLEVRRGRAIWSGSGHSGRVVSVVIGALAGSAVTSLLAGAVVSAGGTGVAEAPTTTGVLTAENIKFVGTGLEIRNGGVLGLFVINKDDFGHTFDVDSLGIHVQLPANSTSAVAIKPTGPGSLKFYCNVTGHRDAGMTGTIIVD